jgi:hypothetical protein
MCYRGAPASRKTQDRQGFWVAALGPVCDRALWFRRVKLGWMKLRFIRFGWVKSSDLELDRLATFRIEVVHISLGRA